MVAAGAAPGIYDAALVRRQALMGSSGPAALVKNFRVFSIAMFACIGGLLYGNWPLHSVNRRLLTSVKDTIRAFSLESSLCQRFRIIWAVMTRQDQKINRKKDG